MTDLLFGLFKMLLRPHLRRFKEIKHRARADDILLNYQWGIRSIKRSLLGVIFSVGLLSLWSTPDILADLKSSDPLIQLREAGLNFTEVLPGVYRSSLVYEETAPLLKELGIKTVLNMHHDVAHARRERDFLKAFDIEMIWLPWRGSEMPRDEDVEKMHELMGDPALKPVLVHCAHGVDRTGVAVATWRIAKQGWTATRAFEEMKAYGHSPVWYGHLGDYIFRYARAHGQSEVRQTSFFERVRTNTVYSIYQLKKLNPFYWTERSATL